MNTSETEWDNHEHIRSELGDYCNLCGEPMPPDTEGKVRDYQNKFYGVKNSFVKSYADAETWSREYLNDHMEALKKFDFLIAELPTLTATVAQEVRDERDTYWKERVEEAYEKVSSGEMDYRDAFKNLLDNLK